MKKRFGFITRGFVDDTLLKLISDADYPDVKQGVRCFAALKLFMAFLFLLFCYFIFSLNINFNPYVLIGILTFAFIGFFYFLDAMLRLEVKRQGKRRLQFLPHLLRLLGIYYESGMSVDNSLKNLSQDVEKFYPMYSKRLNKSHFVMNTQLSRDEAWEKVDQRLATPKLGEISKRIQARETQGIKITEVLNFHAKKIEDELVSEQNEKIERLPIYITVVSIFFFLGSMIVIMGSILFIKMLDVLKSALALL